MPNVSKVPNVVSDNALFAFAVLAACVAHQVEPVCVLVSQQSYSVESCALFHLTWLHLHNTANACLLQHMSSLHPKDLTHSAAMGEAGLVHLAETCFRPASGSDNNHSNK